MMDWKEYEYITKYIYKELGKEAGVKIIGHGGRCKVKGKSGVFHQIDVLTGHTDGIHNYQTAIECKYWEKKVNKDVVMKVVGIIEDTGINKGIIVSKKGFTKDGIAVAKSKNIGIVTLKEIQGVDYNESQKVSSFIVLKGVLKSKTELRRPEILGIKFNSVDKNHETEINNPYQFILKLNSGKEIPFNKYLTAFKDKLHKVEPDKIVKEYYKLNEAKLINLKTNKIICIQGFTVKGKLTIIKKDTTRSIEIIEEVWMIMKAIFENNSFAISKTGLIKKDVT